ncbi:MAG: HDOD domain-containing protein [Candidatus Krumholzibacteria bacterium]|nr:HDOD domain-containing protein [Candidatus Krumholzibacteria bacterium]
MTTETTTSLAAPGWRAVNLDVLKRIEALPSLSTVVNEFLELTRREFFTAKDFEAVISKDQALVARLLRVANSALFGNSRRIHSIPEAVVLVGLENLKKIVFSVSTEGLTRLRLRNYNFEPSRGYWMHSTAVGLAARALVEMLPQKMLHGEEAFVAGLLHDVGKLIVDDFLDPTAGKRPITLAEEAEAAGMNHAELAEFILQQWRLPETIVLAIRDHHCGDESAVMSDGAKILQLAQIIIGTWSIGHGEPVDLSADFDPTPHADRFATVGLPLGKTPQLIWDIRQSLTGLEKLYPED